MTAGQDALREAARLEAALVYGGVRVKPEPNQPMSTTAAHAEAVLANRDARLAEGLAFGMSNSELMQAYGVTYREIQAARRRIGQEN